MGDAGAVRAADRERLDGIQTGGDRDRDGEATGHLDRDVEARADGGRGGRAADRVGRVRHEDTSGSVNGVGAGAPTAGHTRRRGRSRWARRYPATAYAGPMGLADMLAGHPTATPHAEALAQAEHGIAVYWRPGCPYSGRLRMAVRKERDRISWVNIWEDDAGRAYVASVNDGNETVPTVVIDGTAHTNPDPALVKRALAAH